MPKFLSEWLAWFRAKPVGEQAVIGALAVLVAVVASPVLRWASILGFIAVVIALVARAPQRTPVRHLILAAVALLAGFFVFDALASAVYDPLLRGGGPERAQRQEEVTRPEIPEVTTPEPAADSREQEEPEPEPPPTKPVPKPKPAAKIPGLLPVDVYGNLENEGFTCEGPDPIADEVWWTCERSDLSAEYMVEIWGPDTSSVRLVEATALSFDPSTTRETAADFLGYVATVPYKGSNPEEAQLWVQENVDATRRVSTKIGGVEYVLSGAGESRVLEIHPPGSSG